MSKSDRAILVPEGVVFGSEKFKPGQEVELADSDVPAWNLREMAQKGFISGDWSNVGLTPDEEADAIVEAAKPATREE